MYPQKSNAERGFAKRELNRKLARRQAASERQPEVFTPKEGKKMSTIGKVLIAVGTIILIVLCIGGTVFAYRQVKNDFASQAVAPESTLAPATTLGPATQPPIVSDPALDHGNNPQPYIPHPNFYVETGVSDKEYTWTVNVSDGEVMVVGGTSVNGLSGGTYQGFGPGKYTVKVINGFVSVVKAEWGKNEWDFRIGQAVQYNWAHANENPGPIK